MPTITIILIGILASVATFCGGVFAIRYRDKLHLILGFSAGAVIGVAFFDLLPESISLASNNYSISFITSIIALGFVVFMVLDRLFSLHAHQDENCQNTNHRGKAGAGTLSVHSFLDGIAIGLAFKVSIAVGGVVTLAVLAHDFSDGINTVNMILKNKSSRLQAFKWLLVDALAPLAGVISTLFFSLSESVLGIVLAIFCGFFLYIGASDLLPESHHRHPTLYTTLTTLGGIILLYIIVNLARF